MRAFNKYTCSDPEKSACMAMLEGEIGYSAFSQSAEKMQSNQRDGNKDISIVLKQP